MLVSLKNWIDAFVCAKYTPLALELRAALTQLSALTRPKTNTKVTTDGTTIARAQSYSRARSRARLRLRGSTDTSAGAAGLLRHVSSSRTRVVLEKNLRRLAKAERLSAGYVQPRSAR